MCLTWRILIYANFEPMPYHAVYSESKRMTITNAHFSTISGHFFTKCMFIFHKTEVQKILLRCLMGLHLDWFKSYSLRCRCRPCTSLANSQEIATDKWTFYDHIWQFSCLLHVIFQKTEVQKIILRCLTSLHLDWFKSHGLRCRWRPCTSLANSQK